MVDVLMPSRSGAGAVLGPLEAKIMEVVWKEAAQKVSRRQDHPLYGGRFARNVRRSSRFHRRAFAQA
jgi:hypothetical protein